MPRTSFGGPLEGTRLVEDGREPSRPGQSIEEASDRRRGDCAHELVDDAAVLECFDGRNTAHAVLLGESRTGIDIDLLECEVTCARCDLALEYGTESAAWSAPL